ncbi:hypothetical protein PR048_018006 [Dryococelus australis]|uniref:Polyprotein n=1 Tax=Dryococelus australis TaxID=614101 RepID=A0ABQ9HB77_9NEOP|nr:hypothetical protein PR048_018006 [Dryococelus australis]
MSYLSQFLDYPTHSVWNTAKRVRRYLKGTMDSNLIHEQHLEECDKVIIYADADWGADRTDCKSMNGMASFHCALSSAEAEYIAGSLAATELLYLKGLLSEFVGSKGYVKCSLLVDNQGAIHMMRNYENTKRSKHIDITFHFLKDIVAKRLISIKYVESNLNIADMFTKSLESTKFCEIRDKLCLEGKCQSLCVLWSIEDVTFCIYYTSGGNIGRTMKDDVGCILFLKLDMRRALFTLCLKNCKRMNQITFDYAMERLGNVIKHQDTTTRAYVPPREMMAVTISTEAVCDHKSLDIHIEVYRISPVGVSNTNGECDDNCEQLEFPGDSNDYLLHQPTTLGYWHSTTRRQTAKSWPAQTCQVTCANSHYEILFSTARHRADTQSVKIQYTVISDSQMLDR